MFRRGFKTWCETIATEKRRTLSIAVTAALDPRLVAKEMRVAVRYIEQIPNLEPDTLTQLTVNDGSVWSALTVCHNGKYLIVLNSSHPKTREANTLMHELAHLLIGHKPARLDITDDGIIILSSYDQQHEDEANWLAAALLLPRDALVHARKQGLTNEQAAAHYGCSVQLVTMRINTTGVDVQFQRSRARQ